MDATLDRDLEKATANHISGKTETQNAKMHQNIYELIEEEILESDLSLDEKNKKLSRLAKIKYVPLNIMLVGSTGAGKSSTINAMFNMDVAKVGVNANPETEKIESFQLDNITIWDTPGLGDTPENDEKAIKAIQAKLSELDKNGDPVIDLALVILDSSQKDLSTVYDCINNVIVPAMGDDAKKRILICMNQADMAMKGKHWISELNRPDETLIAYLDKKAIEVRRRISETTGINFKPVYYCAGYKEESGDQLMPYNLSKLLYTIIATVPKEKRLAFADVLNPDKEMWEADDMKEDYKKKIKQSFWDVVGDHLSAGADKGMEIGVWVLGAPGGVIGAVTGGAVGAIGGFFAAIFS